MGTKGLANKFLVTMQLFSHISLTMSKCVFIFLKELSVLGFSSLFTPSRNGHGPPDTFDIVKLVNSTYELLQQQQRNIKQLTDLEQKWVQCWPYIRIYVVHLDVFSGSCPIIFIYQISWYHCTVCNFPPICLLFF